MRTEIMTTFPVFLSNSSEIAKNQEGTQLDISSFILQNNDSYSYWGGGVSPLPNRKKEMNNRVTLYKLRYLRNCFLPEKSLLKFYFLTFMSGGVYIYILM